MMKKWRKWLQSLRAVKPEQTPEEATETALRVFPRCC